MYLQPNTQCMRACMCTYNMPIHRIYTCIRMYTVYKHVYVPTASTLMPEMMRCALVLFRAFSLSLSLSLSLCLCLCLCLSCGGSVSLPFCLSLGHLCTCLPARTCAYTAARVRMLSLSLHICACVSVCVCVRVRACACPYLCVLKTCCRHRCSH